MRRPCSRLPSQRTPLRRRYGKPGAHVERRIPPRERPHRLNCACCRPLRCKGGGTSASAACREWPACERCCGRPYYEPSIPTAPEPYLTPLLGEGCSCFCWLPLLDLFRGSVAAVRGAPLPIRRGGRTHPTLRTCLHRRSFRSAAGKPKLCLGAEALPHSPCALLPRSHPYRFCCSSGGSKGGAWVCPPHSTLPTSLQVRHWGWQSCPPTLRVAAAPLIVCKHTPHQRPPPPSLPSPR